MKNILLLSISMCLLTSCARQISSDVYSANHIGEVSATYAGIVKNVREVIVQHGDQLEDNGLGIAGGGVTGGAIGHSLGRGNFYSTAAGAIAGAVTGTFIEKKLKQQKALEYIVELENGQLMTVVQGTDQVFNIGQPVYILVGYAGRSRLIPQAYPQYGMQQSFPG